MTTVRKRVFFSRKKELIHFGAKNKNQLIDQEAAVANPRLSSQSTQSRSQVHRQNRKVLQTKDDLSNHQIKS
jgi:hypothetical protein